jgi:energy-coupling factor transporter ATP-binding protein EcfA2
MHLNPFRYKGPLDLEEDKLVCVPRSDQVKKIIMGINKGYYWSILGPRQIGKTTFLRQIQHEHPNAYHLYFNFEATPSSDENFYPWLVKEILRKIPSKQKALADDWDDEEPEFSFYTFLEKFTPRDAVKKVIFLFDEIDNLPFLRTFLHIWRKIFHERSDIVELNRYSVVLTGSVDLIALTIGPNSPFNIAEIFCMSDFSPGESAVLIDEPFKKFGIEIETKAKGKLISQISGHPQMLQHACHFLYSKAKASNSPIKEKDVDYAIEDLLMTNSSLDTLKQDIKMNDILEYLLNNIIEGKKVKFHTNKEFSVSGAGAITEKKSFCDIRNEVYRKCICDVLRNAKKKTPSGTSKIPFKNEKFLIDIDKILTILSIIIGFVSIIAGSPTGIIVAGILAFIALSILIVYFVVKRF